MHVSKTIEQILLYDEKIKIPERGDREKPCVFGCKKFNPEVVGWYHREMFRLHDLKEWNKLKENAQEMMLALGYNREGAKIASEFVVEAYRNADLAAKAQKLGDTEEERISYNNTLNSFVLASKSLCSDTAGIQYKIGWYKADRHNKPFLVAYYLFREHLKRFGILHLDVAIYTTWVAFWGGYFAHKKHDWKKLESVMIKYWKYIHKVYPIRPPLQI